MKKKKKKKKKTFVFLRGVIIQMMPVKNFDHADKMQKQQNFKKVWE